MGNVKNVENVEVKNEWKVLDLIEFKENNITKGITVKGTISFANGKLKIGPSKFICCFCLDGKNFKVKTFDNNTWETTKRAIRTDKAYQAMYGCLFKFLENQLSELLANK